MNIHAFSGAVVAACLMVTSACDDGESTTGTDTHSHETHETHDTHSHETHDTHSSDTHDTHGSDSDTTEGSDTHETHDTHGSESDATTDDSTTDDSTTDDSMTDDSTTDETTDSTTEDPTGNTTEPYVPPSADDYCACMLQHCHDDYHDNWGEDHMIAEMMCLDFFNGFASAGMSTKEGANQECIAAHCEAAMMGEPTCDSAIGMGVCVD